MDSAGYGCGRNGVPLVMAHRSMRKAAGFTLVELLVGLAVVGILASMIASIMGQGILTSEALMRQSRGETQKTVLRRILHRDIKSMAQGSNIEAVSEGFRILTGHNTLTVSPLPVQVQWSFSHGKITRLERCDDLSYEKEQVLSPELKTFELEFLSPRDNRWTHLNAWLMASDRPAPPAMKLKLEYNDGTTFQMVEHLPPHE